MPITLVTGLPGHGKTLYALWRFQQEAERDKRQVFHNDIRGLAIPGWQGFDAEKWQDLPDGSLVVIDECQKPFPVRGRDRPPPYVEMMAEHRHRGFDFVLITQNPMQFDAYVRRLVDRHFHVVRKFGTHWATVHEFPNGCNESVGRSRQGSIRHEWRYPKQVFDWYKSSEVHTVKVRIPARMWLLIGAPLIAGGLVYYAYHRLSPSEQRSAMESNLARQGVGVSGSPGAAGGSAAAPLSVADYVAAHVPRVEGLPHTAPRFDELTKPMRAPLPMACVATKTRCSCYSQQATRMQVPDSLCRTIVADGFFVDFEDLDARALRERQAGQGVQPQQFVQRVDQAPSTGWQSVPVASLAR